MGNEPSRCLPEHTLMQISSETGFTKTQIESLWKRFQVLDTDCKGYLTREDFLNLPELAINPLGDRIIHSFFQPGQYTEQDSDQLEFHDFIKILAHFRPIKKEKHKERNILNSRREKLKFVFRMYDLDGDDQIERTEVKALLTLMIGDDEQISQEDLEKISASVVNEMGKDDRLISFDEFCEGMAKVDIEHKMSIRLS